jgi:hypothetical protein
MDRPLEPGSLPYIWERMGAFLEERASVSAVQNRTDPRLSRLNPFNRHRFHTGAQLDCSDQEPGWAKCTSISFRCVVLGTSCSGGRKVNSVKPQVGYCTSLPTTYRLKS